MIVSPGVAPGTTIWGVVTEVMPSVLDAPVSELAGSTGVPGPVGGMVSTVIESVLDDVEVLPAGSVAVALTVTV